MEEIVDINISSFQTIIENYETLIKELSKDLDYFKSEHSNLQLKITTLLEENKTLAKKLKDVLSTRENCSVLCKDEQTDLIENLKQQISALLEEKEYTSKLWQNSIRTIDYLEDELKVFQAGTQGFISKKDFVKIKQNYEEKINSLESDLSLNQQKLEDVIRSTSKELSAKNQEVDKSLEAKASALKIVKNLEDEILSLQKRLQDSEKLRVRLEKNLKDKEGFIEDMKRKNTECRAKVAEAVELVSAALNEKDAALFREKEARDEIQKINQELSSIIQDTEEKVRNEVAKVRIEYTLKQDQLLNNLKATQDEIALKSLEIEKYSTKCKLLENEIEKIQKGSFNADESKTSKLLILEKNLESTFQKLLVSEKQNIQLVSERETIRNDMEQMAGHYERTLKTKEVEKLTLQNKIKQLQLELDEGNGNLIRLTEKLQAVNSKIELLEREYQAQREDQERSIKQVYSEKVAQLNTVHNERIKELQAQVESNTEVNKKWASETKFITENLEKLIANLKTEINGLKKENKKLKEKVQECNNKIQQYKVFVQLITQDVNKISSMAVGGGDVT